jgi:cell division protein FtsQ
LSVIASADAPEATEPHAPDGFWHDPARLATATRVIVAMIFVSLICAGAWWAMHRPMFTIVALIVEAPNHTEPRHVTRFELRSTVVRQLKGNFFTIDLEEARLAFETMPWVHAASVRRQWPNGLIVTLEEHTPIGTWGDKGDLLSSRGVAFMGNMAEAEEYGRLTAFNGPTGTEKLVAERYEELRRWLAPVKLQPVALSLSERLSWSVELDGGMILALGRDDAAGAVQDRLNRFLSVYPQLLARLGDRIESVDLRYPHGMAIRAAGLRLKPIPTPS